MKKPQMEDASLDMTPMIDVVFQLIIFFVVTLKMSAEQDETIVLEDGEHGIELTTEELPPSHLMIDVSRTGRISINNFEYTQQMLMQKVKDRKARYGDDFPILIRADIDTKHKDVKKVLDACTTAGMWKLSFVAIKEGKGPNWPKLNDQLTKPAGKVDPKVGKRPSTPWNKWKNERKQRELAKKKAAQGS